MAEQLDSLKSVVGKVAPILGAALTAVSPIAGILLTGLGKLFGTSDEPEAITQAIQADPQAELKLKEFAYQNAELIAKYDLQMQQATYDREVKLAQTPHSNWVMHFIALWLVLTGPFLRVGCVKFLDHASYLLMQTYLGDYQTLCTMVVAYYFGMGALNKLKGSLK